MKPDVIFIPGFLTCGEPTHCLGRVTEHPRQPDSVEISKTSRSSRIRKKKPKRRARRSLGMTSQR